MTPLDLLKVKKYGFFLIENHNFIV